jgi:hypothetical protein
VLDHGIPHNPTSTSAVSVSPKLQAYVSQLAVCYHIFGMDNLVEHANHVNYLAWREFNVL